MERFKKLLEEYQEACESAGAQRAGGMRYRGTVDRAYQIAEHLRKLFAEAQDSAPPEPFACEFCGTHNYCEETTACVKCGRTM